MGKARKKLAKKKLKCLASKDKCVSTLPTSERIEAIETISGKIVFVTGYTASCI